MRAARIPSPTRLSGNVERSLLGGIENDPLSHAAILLGRRRKTDRPHAPTHADNVIILLRHVYDVGLAVIDLIFEFFKKRRCGRKRRKRIFRNQYRPTRTSN